MIISASRRTDIPAFYADWFFNRLEEGFVVTRNPFNANQLSKIRIDSEVVDAIVFWTKNPAPMLDRLNLIDEKGIPYYFQFTITPYKKDLEPGLPSEKTKLVDTFKTLSDMIGPERIIWRYDPILFSDHYSPSYRICAFTRLAELLTGYTEKCIISFLDMNYRNTKNIDSLGISAGTREQQQELAKELAEVAKPKSITIESCAEEIDLSSCEIQHGRCIGPKLIEIITARTLKPKGKKKDANQRHLCGCVGSIDIGIYNTCKHGCEYCYANFSKGIILKNCRQHDPDSPLLLGQCDASKIAFKKDQKSLFEESPGKGTQLSLL